MKRIELDIHEGVAVITLNRPRIHNPLDLVTVQELADVEENIQKDDRVKVVVVRGAGKSFSAGADLTYLRSILHDNQAVRKFILQINRAFDGFESLPVPVIASVKGYALAGGFEMMQACDIVIAAEDAVIGDQHANYGLLPGGGGTQRLPRLIGLQKAKDLLFTGRWVSGREAYTMGLVQHVTTADRLEEETLQLAQRIGRHSRKGIQLMKRLVHEGLQLPLRHAIELEVSQFCEYLRTADPQQGLAAFAEKRQPRFDSAAR